MDSFNEDALDELAQSLADRAHQSGCMLATAESCTGGWVAKVLTDISGSSSWFDRGFVTYSNQSKNEMLGVSMATLEAAGAVSQETVEAMARGAIQNSHASISVAISGIAGPGGGTKEKPVGLVWFAWASSNPHNKIMPVVISASQQFTGDRTAVRRQAVGYALNGLLKQL
jgi:nicotinamide-nucleotide amidase